MYIYLVSFCVSAIFIAISEKKKKFTFYFFSILALLIPCLLAGLRHETIGTDVLVYVKQMFEGAIYSNDFSQYINYSWNSYGYTRYVYEYEPLFYFLTYLVAKITENFQVLLFLIQALTVVPIYIALIKIGKGKFPVWLGMIVYYFIFYSISLNAMRQFISIAFIFLAFAFLLENKMIKVVVLFIIATFFHYSSLIFIFIYLSYLFISNKKQIILKLDNSSKFKLNFNYIILIIIPILFILFNNLALFLLNILGLSDYNNYISGDLSFSLNQIIVRIPVFILIFINWKKLNKTFQYVPFYTFLLYFDLIVSQFSTININAVRIGYYFNIFYLIIIPLICKCSKDKFLNLLNLILCLFYLIFYWYYFYIFLGWNATIPYVFA